MQKAGGIGPNVVASALGYDDSIDITALKERYEEAHRSVVFKHPKLCPFFLKL